MNVEQCYTTVESVHDQEDAIEVLRRERFGSATADEARQLGRAVFRATAPGNEVELLRGILSVSRRGSDATLTNARLEAIERIEDRR
jgi:hypothetical protein